METVYGFGGYKSTISESFKATTSFFDQLVSNINRVRVPLTIGVLAIGFLIGLYNRKIHYAVLILGSVGGLYLLLGLAFPILGLRALQVLIVALVVGIGFLLLKMKKPTMVLVTILVLLSIFGPIRFCYDQTQFIMDEEISSCRFLSSSSSHTIVNYVAVDQVDWGYFTNIAYYNNSHSIKARPSSPLFYIIFNTTMKHNYYTIYNPNVGKEIRENGIIPDYRERIMKSIYSNNKIYSCRETFIVTG